MHLKSGVLEFIEKTGPFEKGPKDFQDFPACHAFGFGFGFIFHLLYILQGFLRAPKSNGHPRSSLSQCLRQ